MLETEKSAWDRWLPFRRNSQVSSEANKIYSRVLDLIAPKGDEQGKILRQQIEKKTKTMVAKLKKEGLNIKQMEVHPLNPLKEHSQINSDYYVLSDDQQYLDSEDYQRTKSSDLNKEKSRISMENANLESRSSCVNRVLQDLLMVNKGF